MGCAGLYQESSLGVLTNVSIALAQLEEYITTHSEALLPHGLCPECLRRLYPDDAEAEAG